MIRFFHSTYLLCLFLLIPGLVQSASATTVVPPTFNELVSQAEVIVEAEVTAKRCEYTPVGDGNVIHTYVTLDVLKQIKGTSPETIELRLLGGTIGNEGMTVEGVPVFEIGDRDVLFIENNGMQYCPLVAVMHGRYPVVTQNGVDVVLRSNGEPLTTPEQVQTSLGHGGSGDIISTGSSGTAMTLAQFETEIAEELSHARNK